MKNSKSLKRVVIVGAGFGGLRAAKNLADRKGVHVTLIDKRNHHLFQPLLYQIAMAGLNPADISMPIRSVFRGRKNVDIFMGKVTQVDLQKQIVHTDFRNFEYDYLILACGASHSYFGNDQWAKYAPPLKSLDHATDIRQRVLKAFEAAERESDPELKRQHMTFVVVGGGPTGVELAGALGEITRYTLTHDFDYIDPSTARVFLIEAGPRILPTFDAQLSDRAARDLESLGIQIWTNALVSKIDEEGVTVGPDRIAARTVLWAAGVQSSPLNKTLGVPLDRKGRVIVEKDLSLKDHRNVFVIGDQAYLEDPNGQPYPGLAPVALQMGAQTARNILSEVHGGPRSEFHYRDKGQMATIGRSRAIVQMGNLKFGGSLAWWTWLFVHIYYLIGFRNKILVLFQWFWSYLTYKRGARLIIEPESMAPEQLMTQPRVSSENQAGTQSGDQESSQPAAQSPTPPQGGPPSSHPVFHSSNDE